MKPKPFIFVLMPFHTDFDNLYYLGIKAAAAKAGCHCERVSDQIYDGNIVDRIYTQIAEADIIVADMSQGNPNVFYEVGYARGLGKRLILLVQDSQEIPFDLKQYYHIVYDKNRIKELTTPLQDRIKHYIKNKGLPNLTGQVKKFDSLTETYRFIVERMNNSKRIDDLLWGKKQTQERSLEDQTEYNKYLSTKEQVLARPDVVYREIFTFPSTERFQRARKLIELLNPGYQVRFFEDSGNHIPRMSFIIFDSNVLVIFFYLKDHASAYKEIRLATTMSHFVDLFQDFYNNIFGAATTLKDGSEVALSALEGLEKKLNII